MPSKRGHLTYQVRNLKMKMVCCRFFLPSLPLIFFDEGVIQAQGGGTAKPYSQQPSLMKNARLTALSFVVLLLSSSGLALLSSPSTGERGHNTAPEIRLEEAFIGFSTESPTSVWNQTPWPSVAVPGGFDFLSVYDYSDVGVLINNNSEASRTIGWAFIEARNISTDRVFVFNNSSAPTKETINRDEFNSYFAEPFLEMLYNRTNASDINYLVTTKGMPLRVNGGNNKASFDQEIALLGGQYNSSVGADYWVEHGYGPLAGKNIEAFSRDTYGFFLVTRLTGYTVETALGLIEKANNSLGERGVFALDLATNRNGSGYKFWNDDLYTANTSLNATMGYATTFDETSTFMTNLSNVMGYASWGSNDGGWASSALPNGGFESINSSTSSGADAWEATLPSLSAGDSFNWTLQSEVQQSGSNALEAEIAAECMPEKADGTPGIFAEFFDNAGVSFNAATMPSLIDRVPDHTRIESQLDYTSRNSAYPGLDNRFKNDWGARFSGLIDVPTAGNWTFYLTSDDGSELWLNDSSLVTNYGSHGMRELSSSIILDAGLHDFRIEFFQGGGPHGLTLHWEGPNQSKALIPATSFLLAGDYIPSASSLQHHWSFEDGSGSVAEDSAQGNANFTLYNMNASNWKNCTDGGCLWYDGVDDYVEVDVQDWSGNFSVSQWVWANATNLPDYASVFAVGSQAGSNTSFQHAVFSGEWRLHNNQTHAFGAVVAQNWTHLVTVFDNGAAHQYLDGVLVRTTVFPQGSLDSIKSYRLGANRAGSTYFHGMIDEVMVWNSALSDGEVTTLNRDIYLDCAAYSGNGQSVASVQQTFAIDEDFEQHSWLASAHGIRSGDVFGTFEIVIEGLDGNGSVVSSHTSTEKEFGTSWSSLTTKFLPHVDAVELRITLPLSLVATSTDGSVYLDSINAYPIRPSHDWVNGSIAETAVSTGGRSFDADTTYGQSLIADLLEDGVSGAKGYVYEPYLTAVGLSSVLLTSYASGYNLAESHAAANLQAGWMGVTVGDPKMAPYADLFHDVHIIDARIPENASYGVPTTVQLAIENRGMAAANGSFLIQDIQGNIELYRGNISLPAGDAQGSYLLLNLTIVPQKTGWMDLRLRYNSDSDSNERITDNNLETLRLWVNAPPLVEAVFCDASIYARGDTFICTVEASDDNQVTEVNLAWTVQADPSNLTNATWVEQTLGTFDAERWQTSITLPTNLTLGWLIIEATAVDDSEQSTSFMVLDVAEVVDAQAQWFGPHVSGIDSDAWSGATPLPYSPGGGVLRGQNTSLNVCVLDADHNPLTEAPAVSSTRGALNGWIHQPQADANHHCYAGSLMLVAGSSLDKLSLEVRSSIGSLLSSRLIGVKDTAPTVNISLIDGDGEPLDRVRGGGGEYLELTFNDLDDPFSSITGDLTVVWPGASTILLPLDIVDIQTPLLVELTSVGQPLESGELAISIEATGRHGASLTVAQQFTFMLTPPSVVQAAICDEVGSVEALRFGETLVLYALVESERALEVQQASMSQLGWSVNAPVLSNEAAMASPVGCFGLETTALDPNQVMMAFRLRLDGSFIDGAGEVLFTVRDIDGLSTSLKMPLNFFHASPSLYAPPLVNATAGDRIEPIAFVEDLDGLTDVQCQATATANGTMLGNFTLVPQVEADEATNGTLRLAFPTTKALNNQTVLFNFTCVDGWGQASAVEVGVTLGPMTSCENCSQISDDAEKTSTLAQSTTVMFVLAVALAILAVVVTLVLRKASSESPPPLWELEEELEAQAIEEGVDAVDSFLLGEGSAIPAGWSPGVFHQWLEGPMPDGWQPEQWVAFREEQMDFFESMPTAPVEKD